MKTKKINFPGTQRAKIWYTYYKIGLLKSFGFTFLKFLFGAVLKGNKTEIFAFLGIFWRFSEFFGTHKLGFGQKIKIYKNWNQTILKGQ